MRDLAISVEGLSKLYRIGRKTSGRTFREALTEAIASRFCGSCQTSDESEFWALKDVSFEVGRGEVVGIVGRNGAGKSTLLKILSRITEPTSGYAEVYGRVGSLLEVGTGFHPELTGRENVYLNGAVLGMKRREINRQFDEIVDFAEVEKFIDTPVKHYSSGMYVRLAFAVAAHLEPEILIVDEVLAVGDAGFQRKCLGKMEDVSRAGRTILFVSHNINAISMLCSRAIYLEQGLVKVVDRTATVVDSYVRDTNGSDIVTDLGQPTTFEEGACSMRLNVLNGSDHSSGTAASGDDLRFLIDVTSDRPLPSCIIGLGINDSGGRRITTLHTRYQCNSSSSVQHSCRFEAFWPDNFLAPGQYRVVIALYDGDEVVAYWDDAWTLSILASDYFGTGRLPEEYQGRALARATWSVTHET